MAPANLPAFRLIGQTWPHVEQTWSSVAKHCPNSAHLSATCQHLVGNLSATGEVARIAAWRASFPRPAGNFLFAARIGLYKARGGGLISKVCHVAQCSIKIGRSRPNIGSNGSSLATCVGQARPTQCLPALGKLWPMFCQTSADFGPKRPQLCPNSPKFDRSWAEFWVPGQRFDKFLGNCTTTCRQLRRSPGATFGHGWKATFSQLSGKLILLFWPLQGCRRQIACRASGRCWPLSSLNFPCPARFPRCTHAQTHRKLQL